MTHYWGKVTYCISIKSKELFKKCLEDLDICYLNLFSSMSIILKLCTLNTSVTLTVPCKTYKHMLNVSPSSYGVVSVVLISTRNRLYEVPTLQQVTNYCFSVLYISSEYQDI